MFMVWNLTFIALKEVAAAVFILREIRFPLGKINEKNERRRKNIVIVKWNKEKKNVVYSDLGIHFVLLWEFFLLKFKFFFGCFMAVFWVNHSILTWHIFGISCQNLFRVYFCIGQYHPAELSGAKKQTKEEQF